jgi:F0F1-type ATP synthase membrane subunit b/b'
MVLDTSCGVSGMPAFGGRRRASQPAMSSIEMSARVLALAQQTADQAVADAQAEADRILAEARAQAEQILAEARQEAGRRPDLEF